MSSFLRQSTASQSRTIGPFFDSTDMITPETGLTIANTDIKLIPNGGSSQNKNSGGATHRANGEYGVTFDATDTATVGELKVNVVVSGATPSFTTFWVLEEAAYDAIFAASAPGYVDGATVNATKIGGTTQTGRDLGASVLLSAGTGTGQLDFTSGVVKANLAQILGTALTETSGQIAAGFKKFFNIATPAATMDHGVLVDTVTTLTNAPSDSSGVTTLLTRIPSGLFTGITSLAQWLGLLAGKQSGNSTARTEIRATGAGSGTFDETTDSQEAIKDTIGSPAGASVSADIATVAGYVDTEVAAIKTKTDQLTFTSSNKVDATIQAAGDFAQGAADKAWSTAARVLTAGTNIALAKGTGVTGFNDLSAAQVNAEVVDALTVDVIADSVPADGSRPTIAQAAYMLTQFMLERAVSGTTVTVKKPDGSTTLMTLTLDDATTPTSVTRAT